MTGNRGSFNGNRRTVTVVGSGRRGFQTRIDVIHRYTLWMSPRVHGPVDPSDCDLRRVVEAPRGVIGLKKRLNPLFYAVDYAAGCRPRFRGRLDRRGRTARHAVQAISAMKSQLP